MKSGYFLTSAGLVLLGLLPFSYLQGEDPVQIDEKRYVLPDPNAGIPEWVGKRKDEPFDVKAYLESRQAPESNAAPLYIYAMSLHSPDFLYLYPEDQKDEVHHRTKPLVDRAANLVGQGQLRELALSSEVDQLLKARRPYLLLIDQAQQRPHCVFMTGLELESLLPHAQAARDIARISQIEIMHACAKSDFARAAHAARRSLRLARDLRPRGLLVTQLVSIAIEGTIVPALLDGYLNAPTLSVDACDSLLAVLKEHQQDPIHLFEEGMKSEYLIMQQTISGMEDGTFHSKDLNIDGPLRSRLNYEIERATANQLFGQLLAPHESRQHSAQALQDLESTLKEMQKKLKAELDSPLNIAALTLRLRKLQNSVIAVLLFPAATDFTEACRRHDARIHGVTLLTAVRLYQLKHGRLPESIDAAVVQADLGGIPLDPYDPHGGKMKYAVVNNKPVIYSIGSDGNDDGGKLDWKFGEQPGDFLFQSP